MEIKEFIRRVTYDQFVRIVFSLKMRYKPILDIFKPYKLRKNIATIETEKTRLFVPKQGAVYYSLVCEPLSFKLFLKCLDSCSVFLDIGAGVGGYSIPAAKHGLKVIALEPDPISYRLLLLNIRLNNVKKIMPLQLATHERKCLLKMRPYVAFEQSPKTYTVEAVPVDELLDELNVKPNIVKIDVDGAEVSVIKGGLRTMKEAKYIFVELRPSTIREVESMLPIIGKKLTIIEHFCSKGFGSLFRPRIKPSDFMVILW